MSSGALKPLHKGKCLQDLKTFYDRDIPKKSVTSLCSSAAKLLSAADEAKKAGNEEECYIYYMKYLNVMSYVQKSDEFRRKKREYNSLIPKDSVANALKSAEKLSESLKSRYEQLSKKEQKGEEKARAENNSSKKECEVSKEILPEENLSLHDALPKSATKKQDSISSMELFKILEKTSSNVLLVDTRPRNQFSDSHIKYDSCVSIPDEILTPGLSANKLYQELPPESKILWEKRLEVDYLVLMDFCSNSASVEPSSALYRLRSIILEWDPLSTYRSEPLILDGGFKDWFDHYPMYCTNSNPQMSELVLDELLDIDDVNYPTLVDDTPKFSRATKPAPKVSYIAPIEQLITPPHQEKESPASPHLDITSAKELENPSRMKNVMPSKTNSTIPIVDRSSKSAALQRYMDMEKDPDINQHVVENDREEQIQRQKCNQLTDKEIESPNYNEANLLSQIQERQTSQKEKDRENERLRKTQEEYDTGLDNSPISKKAVNLPKDIQSKNLDDHNISPRIGLGTPQDIKYTTSIHAPSAGSGMKRSRSSPNIAKLMEGLDIEQKHPKPQFDRSTKPTVLKPQNMEFMNRPRNFYPVYGTGKKGLTGLKNLGNSCYMNSVLQCISNIVPLNDYFCSGTYKDHVNRSHGNPTKGEVAEEVAQVVRNLWLGEYRSIACRDLKVVVGQFMEQFRGNGQQDAHEFLTFLMDWLHNDLKVKKDVESSSEIVKSSDLKKGVELNVYSGAVKAWNHFKRSNESFMLANFFVQQVSTVQCSSCSEKSMNFEEPTSNLTLLLPSSAKCLLRECLELYISTERITGYKCDSCRGTHDAVKTIDLCRLPPILIIHLKRFYSDGFYHKRQTFVDFPLEGLDMRKFTLDRNQRHTLYNLCGVSNHYGTLEGGHYTAYCKNGNRWYKFDDQDVSEISTSEVKSANAYILFYAAVN